MARIPLVDKPILIAGVPSRPVLVPAARLLLRPGNHGWDDRDLLIRQLYDGREVGRMTWRLTAATEPEPQDDQDVDLETRSFPEKHPLLGTGSTRRLP